MCAHRIATKDNSFMDDELFRRCLDQAAAHGINNVVFAAAYGEALLHPKASSTSRKPLTADFR
jgi:hypothetical protein